MIKKNYGKKMYDNKTIQYENGIDTLYKSKLKASIMAFT